MPAGSLVPGYKLVASFGPDSEYETRPSADSGGDEGEEEVEEEVEYVTLEISGIADVDPNLLTSYRLIGVDTPTPFLQLSSSGTIFKGRHHKLLGTELLFSHSQGDSGPSARQISLLGTTEQRIVFSPVEIRNPASSSTLRSAKTPGKESSSNSKKGKKKANAGACGIEEVAGSLGVGVSTSSAPVEQDPAAELGTTTSSKAAGKKKVQVMQDDDDDDDDMYAIEEDDAEEGGGDEMPEENVDGEEQAGEGAADSNDKKEAPIHQSIEDPTTSSTAVAQPDITQGQHQQGPLPAANAPIMAIDPALEALQVPSNQPTPPVPGSGTGI